MDSSLLLFDFYSKSCKSDLWNSPCFGNMTYVKQEGLIVREKKLFYFFHCKMIIRFQSSFGCAENM